MADLLRPGPPGSGEPAAELAPVATPTRSPSPSVAPAAPFDAPWSPNAVGGTGYEGGVDPRLARLTDVWLRVQRSPRTRDAYRQDVQQWLVHCANAAVDPMRARASDVDAWIIAQRTSGARGCRPASEA